MKYSIIDSFIIWIKTHQSMPYMDLILKHPILLQAVKKIKMHYF